MMVGCRKLKERCRQVWDLPTSVKEKLLDASDVIFCKLEKE